MRRHDRPRCDDRRVHAHEPYCNEAVQKLPLRQQHAGPGQQQARRQTPEEWTDEYVGKVRASTVTDALTALQSRSANALARLKADHPALHERAVTAGVEQAAKFAPAHDPEGPDDREMGESFNDDGDPFANDTQEFVSWKSSPSG